MINKLYQRAKELAKPLIGLTVRVVYITVVVILVVELCL